MNTVGWKNKFKNVLTNCHCATCETLACSVLKDCSRESLDAISAAKESMLFEKGSRIITAGGAVNGVYFINKGKIKVYKVTKGYKEWR
jgi:CRP/FNR family transcriptional regulator, anaerobic regulatory protein